jgi:hypothetical protein
MFLKCIKTFLDNWISLLQAGQELNALHIACREGMTDIVELIIKATENSKQVMITSNGQYVRGQPSLEELLIMEGPEVC